MIASLASFAVLSGQITSCVCVDVLPAVSVYVHLMVVLAVMGKVTSGEAIICPSQLSVAVGAVKSAIVATGHPPVSVGKFDISGTGASVSPIITSCVCVVVLSASSVYVHVIVVFVVIGGVIPVVAVMVPSQLSEAVGAVREVVCEQSSIVGKSAVKGTGSVVSSIVTCCVCVVVLPTASV